MTDIADYLEDRVADGRAVARRLLGAMLDLDIADAVIAQWGDASSSIGVVRADGSMYSTGRQSAYYSHRCWDARDGEETDGAISLWWQAGGWRVSVEDAETEVLVEPAQDEDEDEDDHEDHAA